MSTFFEKLTGARPRPEDDDRTPAPPHREPPRHTPPHKEPPNPHARHEEESRPTHLKVESEERPARRPEPAPEPVEEEGELTVDIYDKGDAIVIQSTVAGVKPEDLDVSITSDSVTIRGKREA